MQSVTTIRPAVASDAPAIAAIWNQLIRDTDVTFNPVEKPVQEIQTLIAERSEKGWGFFVAEDDGKLLGYATYAQFRGGMGYVRSMEHSIHIAPAGQGRGIGRALMQAIEDHARAAGVHVMVGGITGTNKGSVDFHARLGYEIVGRMPEQGWKFDRYHDLVLMQKLL
ncbi:MAG: GNAT family N-acetyltransferase [Paracoccaceae bacterium]